MKRTAWTLLSALLITTYFLSSIPGLKVLPVLRQLNELLLSFDVSITRLAGEISGRLPAQLGPAKTLAGDFLAYARENPVLIEFLLRKAAHIGLFFLITIALFLLLRQYLTNYGAAAGAFILAGLMAFLDEYHQTFVSSRSGNLVDVGIDMVGVTMATAFIIFALLITGRWRK